MRKKCIVVLFLLLFIIAAIEPLTGKLNLEKTTEETTHISDWITLPDPSQVDMLLE